MTTSQIWPQIAEPRTLTRQVWDVRTARRIPGVGRALDLIGGLVSQMPLDQYAGIVPVTPRPPLLEQPDPDLDLATFVAVQVEDWLLHGNAAHLVTARYRDSGWPAAAKWFPASQWHCDVESGRKRWWLNGREVRDGDVVHVQNGANPMTPYVGMGVVEKYVLDLDRIATQSERERVDTRDGQVPSIAVEVPQRDPDPQDLDDAAVLWQDKFGDPYEGRKPVFLPNGTKVTPLGWNPSDAQAAELRKLALVDTANMFNLDPYWLGAPASSHTYRTPGAMFLTLIRTTLGRIIVPFEQTWSTYWLPRGRRVTFDREAIQADDLANMVNTLVKATGNRPVMTTNEARTRLKLTPVDGGDELPADTEAPAPPDDQDDDDDDEKLEQEEQER